MSYANASMHLGRQTCNEFDLWLFNSYKKSTCLFGWLQCVSIGLSSNRAMKHVVFASIPPSERPAMFKLLPGCGLVEFNNYSTFGSCLSWSILLFWYGSCLPNGPMEFAVNSACLASACFKLVHGFTQYFISDILMHMHPCNHLRLFIKPDTEEMLPAVEIWPWLLGGRLPGLSLRYDCVDKWLPPSSPSFQQSPSCCCNWHP